MKAPRSTRHHGSLAVWAVTVALVLVGCSGSSATDEPEESESDPAAVEETTGDATSTDGGGDLTTVRASSQPNAAGFPMWLAGELGYYEEAGLEVEIEYFPSGPPQMESGLAGGWDVAWTGGPPAINSAQQWGAIVAGVLIEEGPNHEMFMRAEALESQEPADILRDGTTLVSVNSVAHLTMLACADHFGIDPDEVDFVPLDGAETIQAFSSGEGDAAMAWSPPSVRLITDPDGSYESVCTAEQSGNMIYSNYVVHPEYWESEPETAAAWLDAAYRANEFINDNPDEALDYMLEYYDDIGNEGGEESATIELERRNFYSLEQNLEAFESGEFEEVVGTMAEFFVDAGAWTEMPDVAAIAETGREVAEAAAASS